MNKVKINFLYNVSYQILAIILPLITTPYISRVLGAEKLGIYSYAYSIASYFALFIKLGLNNYGNRSIAMIKDNKEKLSSTFWEIYMMQLMTATIVIAIYALFIANDIMAWVFLVYLMANALDISWFFFGLEEFKLTVARNFIVKIISTLCIFLFVKDEQDVYVYGVIIVLGTLFSSSVLWTYLRKEGIVPVKINMNDVVKHFKPNIILFIPVVAISVYKIMDKIMLGNMSDMRAVGLYESAERVVQMPVIVINALGTVMLPRMSNLIAKNKVKESMKYLEKSIVFAMFLATSVCFGIMAVANDFVPWFYGMGYEECVVLFKILMPSCIFLAFANVIRTQFLIPNKEDKIYIQSVIIGATVNFIINIILIPRYAASGAAIGTLVAEACVCIWQAWKIRNKIELVRYLKSSIPFVIMGIIMYIVLLSLPQFVKGRLFSMMCRVIIGSMIYLSQLSIYVFVRGKRKHK